MVRGNDLMGDLVAGKRNSRVKKKGWVFASMIGFVGWAMLTAKIMCVPNTIL